MQAQRESKHKFHHQTDQEAGGESLTSLTTNQTTSLTSNPSDSPTATTIVSQIQSKKQNLCLTMSAIVTPTESHYCPHHPNLSRSTLNRAFLQFAREASPKKNQCNGEDCLSPHNGNLSNLSVNAAKCGQSSKPNSNADAIVKSK